MRLRVPGENTNVWWPMMFFLIALAASAGTLFVLLVVHNATSRERKVDYQISPFSAGDPTFRRCMDHLLGPPLVDGNSVKSLLNGDEIFPAMMQAVRSAKRSITFETYIYWSGDIGRAFSELLAERAAAGVRVHVLLDWVGSAKLDANALDMMKNAGVQVEKYRPLRWYNLSRVNSRTHRKILVVDGRLDLSEVSGSLTNGKAMLRVQNTGGIHISKSKVPRSHICKRRSSITGSKRVPRY